MTPPLLSLIVPVYNVAPYLPQCLESLAALTPAADEIIVVDDGSTDDCPRILAEFAPRLPQMRVIRQENGGLSAARNTGLDAAHGKYLAFVDADDFVSPDAYAEALQLAEGGQLDMVLLNANYHFEGREQDYAIYADAEPTSVIPGSEWLRQRLRAGRFLHMVWMHLYRRDFIEANGFRFVPRLIHEDVIWTTRALLAARRVRYTGHIAVHYRIPLRKFTAEQSQRRLELIRDSSVTNAHALAEMADSLGGDADLRRLLNHQLVDGALSIFHKLEKMPSRAIANHSLLELRQSGFLGMLWRHASDMAQYRRIARHWLRSWLAGVGK
ncbi:MAG: glycosyltransferase [Sulfuritalea sp.]|jgi:glycosyltransferase involved in cell wall biosynthesis|nr:glycosyltransferase [Sulfuritalea sp.]